MSAHVVAKTHVDVLVRAALDAKDHGIAPPQDFRWWRVDEDGRYAGWRVVDPLAGPDVGLRFDTEYEAFYTPSQAGQILVAENVASVAHRYPNDRPGDGELPGPCDAYYVAPYVYADPGRSFSPGEVFKAIDYLDYQSCEHPGWETSEAYSLLRFLREAYCRRVAGYDEAPYGFDRLVGGPRGRPVTRRDRLERRAARRREWAESREAKSEAAFEGARRVADGIPFGQPILVGHHSERGARRDQARIERGMVAGHENARKASDHEATADGIERQLATSVYSDDADAPERLREQTAELEAERDRIKAYNASCRRGARDVSLLDEKQREDLAVTARVAAYSLGKNGEFPSYVLSNLGARIREKKKRVERIERDRETVESGGRGVGRAMVSRYAGVCAGCGQGIERGEQILWYRLTREAVHATCPAEDAA